MESTTMATPTKGPPARQRTMTDSTTNSSTVTRSGCGSSNGSHGGEDEVVALPRCFPHCCGKPILHGNPEALVGCCAVCAALC